MLFLRPASHGASRSHNTTICTGDEDPAPSLVTPSVPRWPRRQRTAHSSVRRGAATTAWQGLPRTRHWRGHTACAVSSSGPHATTNKARGWSVFREGQWNRGSAWNTSPKNSRELLVFSEKKREGRGEPCHFLQLLKGACG